MQKSQATLWKTCLANDNNLLNKITPHDGSFFNL